MCERSRAISPCHMNLHTQDHKSDGTRWIMIFDVPSASLLLLVKVVSCEMLCKLKISRVWFVFVLFVVLAVCCVCIAVAVMIWCWCAVDSLRRYEIDLPRCVASMPLPSPLSILYRIDHALEPHDFNSMSYNCFVSVLVVNLDLLGYLFICTLHERLFVTGSFRYHAHFHLSSPRIFTNFFHRLEK